ncbi:MAG: tRNA nucleotidyltransferase [Phormidesmis priestleyi]|uniref:tRNA nucleotidyltransferase n=1 Tax=Phormidesmis priestleyi TaxID=268141 RepID=A0A2W4XJQ3_9CYAN|nr:MAG: tRNA nucleotidyltransferase [Phormidesmis priestleyi]
MFLLESLPFPLDRLPESAYFVGGSVRDLLLNRQAAYLDLDIVLPSQSIETADKIARDYKAGFVVLDQDRGIARLVFEQMTIDFAQQQGSSIEADLQRRDFTINAIAYQPHHQRWLDPLGGQADIATQTIRMISAENLRADPLRLLRAYRQAAQLGFEIEPDTQAAIAQLAPYLSQVAYERIRSELDALLILPAGTHQLTTVLQHQLLTFCLPHFTATSLEQMQAIDHAIIQFETALPDYAKQLQAWPKPVPAGSYRSWIKAAKLSRAISSKSKTAETELTALTYSRYEIKAVLTLLKLQPMLMALRQGPLNRSQQFFLFKSAGECFPAVSLLALAQGVELAVLTPLVKRFLDGSDAIAHSQPLITGTLLMDHLAISPGPEVGKLMKAVEKAQAEGIVQTEEEAIAWLKALKAK